MMERTFLKIQNGNLGDVDQRLILDSLGLSNGIEWDALLRHRRVLIVSEAGAGKTFECRSQASRLWDAGESAFFIELAALSNEDLRVQLDDEQEERFNNWCTSQSNVATFFLDSIDELKLTQNSFEFALKRFKKEIRRERLHRVRIVVTTRPIEFDKQVLRRVLPIPFVPNAEDFAKIAMGRDQSSSRVSDWRMVALMPLSDEQIAEFASNQGINDTDALLTEIRRRNAQDFARRPQDLIELCADWQGNERIRTHLDQVKANVRIKLQPRTDRPELAELSFDKAMAGACKLALAMLVTRRMTIKHSAASDDLSEEAALDPAHILSNWTLDERKALLERPLFGFASYGRVRFHHRSVSEYLAAKRLRTLLEDGKPFRSIKRLLFTESNGKMIVFPSKRPVAGWLSLFNDRVFELLRDNEPDVLLNEGDPESLLPMQRGQILRAYVARHGLGGRRGLEVPHIQIHRFASSDLANVINELWKTGIQNSEVRQILLNLVEAGPIRECAHIANDVACDENASTVERLYAIDTLIAIRDSRVNNIVSELVVNNPRWPDKIASGIVIRMFPKYLTINQLCQILEWVKEEVHENRKLSWILPQLIAETEFNLSDLECLRNDLICLSSAGLHWVEDKRCLDCDRSHLGSALAMVCIKGLDHSRSDDWLKASLHAVCLNCHDGGSSKDAFNLLRNCLTNFNADVNSRLFWMADTFIQKYQHTDDPWVRLIQVNHNMDGPVKLTAKRDLIWVMEALGDTSKSKDDRAFLLEVALSLPPDHEQIEAHCTGLKLLVANQSELKVRIEKHFELHQATKNRCLEKASSKTTKKHLNEDRAKIDWELFWDFVSKQPEHAFSSKHSFTTTLNLWKAMKVKGEYSQDSGWDRRFIEEHFSKETTDRLRNSLMNIWRNWHLDHLGEGSEDEPNLEHTMIRLGLTAIHAEAEDSSWATRLSEDEAKLATRYACFEMNGIPLWMENVVDVFPDAVDEILMTELNKELNINATYVGHNHLFLQHILYSPNSIASRCVPRLLDWLNKNCRTIATADKTTEIAHRYLQISQILLKHGGNDEQQCLCKNAQRQLRLKPPEEIEHVLLSTIMQINPEFGVSELEELFREVEPAVESKAVKCFSVLFWNLQYRINLDKEAFTPQLLIRLVRLAYNHVRSDDDVTHEGTYTPDMRDNAQYARNAILTALLNAKGKEGWDAKMLIAKDKLCDHINDRIIAFANENWAQEIDSETYNLKQAILLDKTGEAPPSSNRTMFALMKDRLSDLDELLLSDSSPRDTWASITKEKVMRREISRELRNTACDLYKINQEAVTSEEYETDIRLCSTVSEHEAVIELKLANNWSAKNLLDTIYNQLVKKYLEPDNRKSGCLLITLNNNRTWKHPKNGKTLDLAGLKLLLCDEAKRVENELAGDIRLCVHVLDLRE